MLLQVINIFIFDIYNNSYVRIFALYKVPDLILYNVVKLLTSVLENELYIINVLFNSRVTTNTMISTCLEYGLGGEASMRGDVYSFGILLLEIFTRRRPTESMFNEGLTLHEFGKRALPEKVMEIVDPSLLPLEEERTNSRRVRNEECLVAVIKTGVACSIESPFDRMEMTDVVVKLCHARQNFLGQRI